MEKANLEDRKAGIGIGVLVLIGLVVWGFSRKKEAAAAIARVAPTESPLTSKSISATEAPAVVGEYLEKIASKYSGDEGLLAQIAQAKQSIALNAAQGIAPAEDPGAAVFAGQLQAFEIYKSQGGTKAFNEFTMFTNIEAECPEGYAVIQAQKQAFQVREANAVIETYTKTDPYGKPTGEISPNLVNYLNQLSEANPLKQELLKRPEVKQALAAPAPAPAPAVPVAVPTQPPVVAYPGAPPPPGYGYGLAYYGMVY